MCLPIDGIGTTNPTYPFVVTATNSATSGWGPTVQYYTGVYPASTSTGTHIGVYNGIGNAGSTVNFSSANIWGAQNEANHGATTTLGTLIASVNDANNTASGNINAAYGSQAYINNSGSGTITNAYGLYARISNTSTISSAYGVYVDAIEGSNKWSFYAADASARNYFAGAVGHQYQHALDSNLARFDRSTSDEFRAGASFSARAASKMQRLSSRTAPKILEEVTEHFPTVRRQPDLAISHPSRAEVTSKIRKAPFVLENGWI